MTSLTMDRIQPNLGCNTVLSEIIPISLRILCPEMFLSRLRESVSNRTIFITTLDDLLISQLQEQVGQVLVRTVQIP